MRKSRVLVLTPDFPPAHGGVQVLSQRLVEQLQGFQALVLTLGFPGDAAFDSTQPFRVQRVHVSSRLDHKVAVAQLNALALRTAQTFRPDVVLSMHIVTSLAARGIRRLWGTPYVQYLHCQEVARGQWLASFAVRDAAAIIPVSRHTAALAVACDGDAARIHIIPPGVDIPANGSHEPYERPIIVTISRLEERYKGHDVLLRALPLIRSRVPDVLWVVIGDGVLRHAYEGQAQAFGVESSVLFTGSVTDAVRDTWLRRARVFAMLSRIPPDGGGEGFGIVYLEAAARGVPVVAGNVAGALDAVVGGETGLLIDPTDHLAAADAIGNLLLDGERARTMGEAARARARSFAWPVIGRRVEALLAAVARGDACASST